MKKLRFPHDIAMIKTLTAGDEVLLSGVIFTARDVAHKRLYDMVLKKKKLPVDLSQSILYYCGPTPEKPGEVIGSSGPTTAGRMDAFTPLLLDRGLKVMIGKGSRSAAVKMAMKKHQAIYFVTYGGCGAYIQSCVIASEVVAFPELGAEAIYKLTVENLPAVVGIDSCGRELPGLAQ